MKPKNQYRICRNDIILAGVYAAAAVIILICISVFRSGSSADRVLITLSGNVYGTYNLHENRIIEVESENSSNIVVIEDGAVYMKEADCPDRYCISTGKISRVGETIVCLPHRIVVELEKSEGSSADIDAIAQ
ncbi:MAG: NusG domain II-containing protein [Parasporobacterium sp.]|nr:NusG domain II-containing protein [Parasporobacterium sp.]